MIIRINRIMRLGRREDGTAAVELALCLIPLLILLAGFIDLGIGYYTKLEVDNISRAAARYATMYQLDATGQHITSINIAQYVLSNYGDTFTVTPSTATYSAGGAVNITVTKNIPWLFYGFLSSYVKLPQEAKGATSMTFE